MLDFIIWWALSFVFIFLGSTAVEYYYKKQLSKDYIISGLITAILVAAVATFLIHSHKFDYPLVIIGSIVIGIMGFLLITIKKYYVSKAPLKESIISGLKAGIIFVTLTMGPILLGFL